MSGLPFFKVKLEIKPPIIAITIPIKVTKICGIILNEKRTLFIKYSLNLILTTILITNNNKFENILLINPIMTALLKILT